MNEHILKGDWDEMQGELKEYWGRLTDNELEATGGRTNQLVTLLQQRYGYTRERAEARLAQVEATVRQN